MAPNTIPINKIANFGDTNWELEGRDFLPKGEDNAMLPLFTVCTVDTRCFIVSTAL